MSNTIIRDPELEPFYISKDNYCYTIVEAITPDPKNLEKGKKGKVYEKPIGHYSTLGNALYAISRNKLRMKQEYSSIKEYMQEWKKIQEDFKQLLNKLDI